MRRATRYDVFARTTRRKREPMGFVVNGHSYQDATARAAEILRIPVDLIHLEVAA